MLPVFILAPEWQELPERLGAGGGAPVFAPAGRPLGGATLTAPPLAGSTDLVVCMSTDRVWGLLDAGSTVTVTVGTAQMGAAQADGVGFFWTTLYDGSGDRPGLDGEESVAVYQDGVQQASLTLRAITATLYLVTDTVVGQVDTNTPLSVTVYAMDDQLPEPTMTTYSQTVSTDGSGNFTVDLTGIWDFIG